MILTDARFIGFLLCSLLLHGLAWLAWPNASSLHESVLTDGATLQLSLQSSSRDAAQRSALSPSLSDEPGAMVDEAGTGRPEPEPEVTPALREQVPAPVFAHQERMMPSPVEGGNGDGIDSAIRAPVSAPSSTETGALGAAEVRARLGEAVATYFYYPPLARRRGWEGEVIVGIRVESDGRLSAIEIIASSGYRVLDNAAVESLKRMARLSESAGLPQAGIEVRLPVRYQLVDSPA